MQTDKPLVSVLMTAYNREKYIAEAIESVLASTYQNLELIIVDDGSKDNTVAIINSMAAKDSRIRVYINEKNLGDYPNRNRAASYAKGDFITYTDSDDKLFDFAIEKYVSFLKVYPNLNIALYFGIEGSTPDTDPIVVASDTAIKDHYFKKPFLLAGPGGIFVRRSFFESIGKYPEKYGPANDMYFNVKAASFTDILLVPFSPIFYRQHGEQESNNLFSYIYNNYRYNKDLITDLVLPLSEKEKKFILKKNKRRFVVNTFRYLKKTKDIKKTLELFKNAGVSFGDALSGIFH